MNEAAELLARHVSPDGTLTLSAYRTIEQRGPLVTLGFEEGAWHFHPTAEEAIRIVKAVLADEVVILTERRPHGEDQTQLLASLELEVDFYQPGTELEFRLWSGRKVSFEELVDGRVPYTDLDDLWQWRIEAKA